MPTAGISIAVYALAALGAIAVFLAMPGGGSGRRVPAVVLGLAAIAGLLVLLARSAAGSAGDAVIFSMLTLLSVVGAVRVITHPKPVYAALYFVLVALASVGLILMVGAEFLGAALVIVYAGAILVTYVFVIMLAQQSPEQQQVIAGGPLDYDGVAREPALATVAGFLLMGALGGLLMNQPHATASPPGATTGNTLGLGAVLLTQYAVAVELAGVLLLVAIVGAIALARRAVEAEPRVVPAAPERPLGEAGRTVKPF